MEHWTEMEMAWVGEMAVSERGNLSIFAKQINRINRLSIKRDKSWVDLKFFGFTGASTFVLAIMHFATTQ